jgi:hypothetical protein
MAEPGVLACQSTLVKQPGTSAHTEDKLDGTGPAIVDKLFLVAVSAFCAAALLLLLDTVCLPLAITHLLPTTRTIPPLEPARIVLE